MEKRQPDVWYPFFIDKWLFGSTRIELEPDERGVWVDLMTLSKKDNGYIRANVGVPYLESQLSGLLNIPPELLKRTIEKCLRPKINKLRKEKDGTLYVLSTENYKLSKRQQRRIKAKMTAEADTTAADADIEGEVADAKNRIDKNRIEEKRIKYIVEQTISYLNEKTGKRFSSKTKEAIKFIKARLLEGRTPEDFKKVIDIKVAKWKGKSWEDNRTGETVYGDDFLRPSTLFRPGHFEEYLNEIMPVKKIEPGERNIEREKREQELRDKWRLEYQKLKEKYMKEKNIKNEEDIDPFDFPTLLEFARKKEEK